MSAYLKFMNHGVPWTIVEARDLKKRKKLVRIPEINHAHSNDTFEYGRRHAFLPRDRPRSNTIIRGFHDQPRGRYFHHSQFKPSRQISQSKKGGSLVLN